MRYLLTIALFWGLILNGIAQTDSTGRTIREPFNFKAQIVPLSLITAGTIIQFTDWKYEFQESVVKTNTSADDYLRFVPIAEMYIADAFKIPHKNSVWNQTKFLVISQIINNALTFSLKAITHVQRPDSSNYHSFPSGHTSAAFTNATVLYHEFRESSIYLALSGYLFASATGVLRVTNNKHYISDVLFGAGLGILVTNLVYWLEPFKSWDPFNFDKNIVIIPDLNFASKRVGLTVRF